MTQTPQQSLEVNPPFFGPILASVIYCIPLFFTINKDSTDPAVLLFFNSYKVSSTDARDVSLFNQSLIRKLRYQFQDDRNSQDKQ